MSAASIRVGTRVAFSTLFLRSSQERPTSPRWGDRGEVVAIHADVLAEIRWDGGHTSTVNIGNLSPTAKGLTGDTPMAVGDAWNGTGFQKTHGL